MLPSPLASTVSNESGWNSTTTSDAVRSPGTFSTWTVIGTRPSTYVATGETSLIHTAFGSRNKKGTDTDFLRQDCNCEHAATVISASPKVVLSVRSSRNTSTVVSDDSALETETTWTFTLAPALA